MRKGILFNKRGLSEIIGYVLLISMTMILSVIIYQWIKTYIPKESIECDDGVSIFVQNYSYDCTERNSDSQILNLTVKNSGRFDIAGYFIHATTERGQKLAVKDLSNNTANGKGGAVNYWDGGNNLNPLSPSSTRKDSFNLTSIGQIYSVQLVPLRYQEIGGKNRPVSCTNGKITQEVKCTIGEICVPATCSSLGKQCGTPSNECGGTLDCGTCTSGFNCISGGCVDASLCGNGGLDSGEQCEGTNLNSQSCSSVFGTGWTGTLSCSPSCAFDTSGCTAPDLIVINSPLPSASRSNGDGNNDLLTIQFNIKNQGNANAENSIWKVEDTSSINPSDDGPKTDNTGIIIQGNSYPGSATLTYSGQLDTATIKITADSTGIINELDNNNNIININVDCLTPLKSNGIGSCNVALA